MLFLFAEVHRVYKSLRLLVRLNEHARLAKRKDGDEKVPVPGRWDIHKGPRREAPCGARRAAAGQPDRASEAGRGEGVEENTADKKKCRGKGKGMFVYGILQLSSSVISAVALAAIALSLCSVKQESKVFNECVEEVQSNGKSSSGAVRFCNGGQ